MLKKSTTKMYRTIKVWSIASSYLFVSVLGIFKLPESYLANEAMMKYIVDIDLRHSTIFGESTTFLITDHMPQATSMVRRFSQRVGVPIIVFRQGFSKLRLKNLNPCLTYIFISDLTRSDDILLELLRSTAYKVHTPVVLVVCGQIKEEEAQEVPFLLRRVWSYGFHRVIMMYISDELHIKRYNPFLREFYEVSPNKSTIFVNQLRNLYGYKFRVGLFEEWPLLKRNGNWWSLKEKWIGRDITLLDNLMRLLNATYVVIEPQKGTRYKGAANDIMHNKTDFCFVRYYQTTDFERVEFTEFNDIASLQVLLPKPHKISQSHSLINILRRRVWIASFICMCILVVSMKLIFYLKTKLPWNIISIFLDVWGIFLGSAVQRYHKYLDVLKITVMFWIWASLILNVLFQISLINLMQFIEYDHGLRNLDDLIQSKIPVYSSFNVTDLTGNTSLFKGQLREVNHTKLRDVLWYEKPNAAFVVSFGVVRGHLNLDLFPRNQSISYFIMPESLSSSYAVYLFRKNSPFTRTVGKRILELRSYGFATKLMQKNQNFEVEEIDLKRLDLQQVEAPFSLWLSGMILSLVVFFWEFILYPQTWR